MLASKPCQMYENVGVMACPLLAAHCCWQYSPNDRRDHEDEKTTSGNCTSGADFFNLRTIVQYHHYANTAKRKGEYLWKKQRCTLQIFAPRLLAMACPPS